MDYHYKAFISYRHAELDSKVAVEIQNMIERYRIPGSIRKELGIKSIGRVFRDKDELPSTSDLNDNIKNAITNSEYLICICSPRYIESIWCQKEIEFFLESHDKHHVLTVLAEGDPYEVVPEVLCNETMTVKDENGNDVTIEARLEPLSCDYRGDRHRARNEEFPRLAAVLIGCGYADLRQKMRKRRMRMMAATAAFGAALAAYFIWSYINIQINYKKSLINQSEYLASTAQKALDNNDNILAAQLSLAALPDAGKDRPVVPEAVYTLSQAIGAYQARKVLNFRGVASYTSQSGQLSRYSVTPDAHYIAMINTRGDMEVCDLTENNSLYTISSYDLFGSAADRVISCGNDRMLLYSIYGEDIALIRSSDGEVLWYQKVEKATKRILPFGGSDASALVVLMEQEVVILNSENGDIMDQFSISDVSGGEATNIYRLLYDNGERCVSVSNDRESFCMLCTFKDEDKNEHVRGILTYDYKTKKTGWTPYAVEAFHYESTDRDADGHILVAFAENEGDYRVTSLYYGSNITSFGDFNEGKVKLVLLEEGSGKVLWENSMTYSGMRDSEYSCFDIRTLPGDDSHPDRKTVLGAVSNKVYLFDVQDGKVYKEITLSDWIVSVEKQTDRKAPVWVNGASGTQYYFDHYSENYSGLSFMEGNVDYVSFIHADEAYDGVSQYIVLEGNTIRVFKADQGDNDFKLFGFEFPEVDVSSRFIVGSKLVVGDINDKLYAYDMETEEKLWETEFDSENNYILRGVTKDNSYLFMTTSEDYEHKNMIRISMEDGTWEKVNITENDLLTGAGRWEFDCNNAVVAGDHIFFRAANYNSNTSYWFRYSMADGSTVILKLPYYENLEYGGRSKEEAAMFAQDGSKGVIYYQHAVYLADFEKGTVTATDIEIPGVTLYAYQDKDGSFAFYNQSAAEGENLKALYVYGADGKPKWEINNLADTVTAMNFYKDCLIVVTDSRRIYAYNAKTGTQEGMINIDCTITQSYDWQLYDMGGDDLVIDNGSGRLIMIDIGNWALTGIAYNTVGLCPDLRRVIITNDVKEMKFGYCPYYSVEDLVEKGKIFVGEQTLSEADKAVYGVQ